MCGNYNSGGHGDGKDIYDLVEWLAEQDWCDGNIGMIGISYFASVQILGAAEQPPHLKAIFANGGHFDLYELCYHGGIMWLMPRASREGRGGDSGNAFNNVASKSSKVFSPEELKQNNSRTLKRSRYCTLVRLRPPFTLSRSSRIMDGLLIKPT